MTIAKERNQQLEKLRELVKGIDFCMLTSVDEDGSLHSRPMSTNGEIEDNGDVWFFTYASTHKVWEIERHHQVNLSFADPSKQRYVSMSGNAELVRDRQKMQQLWKPQLQAWFPKELEEPDIALIKVNITKAEYWDSPSSWVAHTVGLLKAMATGEKASMGENEQINLDLK